jgi:hypothetical protein
MNGLVGKFVHPAAVAIDYDMFRVHFYTFLIAPKVRILFSRTQFPSIRSIILLRNPYKQGMKRSCPPPVLPVATSSGTSDVFEEMKKMIGWELHGYSVGTLLTHKDLQGLRDTGNTGVKIIRQKNLQNNLVCITNYIKFAA